MAKLLNKTYEPAEVEKRIYDMWLEGGYFKGVVDPEKKPFTIVIPPPNVTGQLHLGHAFDETIQDILIRYKRMQGFAALWLPGTDHAGIATQIKVEEALRNEGLSRYDLGRERFVERVWEWKAQYGSRIIEQLKKLGSSCDWDRERFTMDEGLSRAVREVFVNMYEKGLIYKGSRIINWCPTCITALSDTEVEHEDQAGHLWHIKYPIKDSDEFIIVATTRPETMLGDSGVAVNPSDERYTHLIGKKAILPLVGREIPIIADEYVDASFGTGCVKMTPGHDPNDFEVGLRHNLEQIVVLDDEAKVNELGGKYQGLDRYEARKVILAELEELGLLHEVKDYSHSVGTCYRCGTTVEPIISAQWFVKMEPLAKEATAVVDRGDIEFVPERFHKIYTNWMENVHDWCISRQLWWGHRIPAFYCDDCGHITVSRTDPEACEKCGGNKLRQDEDVLDTWFSSALWPFSTLGWPDKTPELEYFYPTDVLVTGYDIIFFWVARMIFSGMEQMKQEPFKTVLFHGLVRDGKGKKMSKSAGNGVDPIDMIENFGADALRFNMITGNSPGNDMRFYVERCEAMRNFANKLWNAARFVMMNLTIEKCELPPPEKLKMEDKWILSKLNSLISEITDNLDQFELGVAASKIYDFIWDSFCDWYIELTKPRLGGDDSENAQQVLCWVLTEILKLLHPFMPFITEEIWQSLPHEGEALMTASWPEYKNALGFPTEEMEMVMSVIRTVRARRAEMNIPPSKKAEVIIVTDRTASFEKGRGFIQKLAYASELLIQAEELSDTNGMVAAATGEAKIFMPLHDLVDVGKELARIKKEKEAAEKSLAGLMSKLENADFLAKAPESIISAEKEKAEKLKAKLEKLDENARMFL